MVGISKSFLTFSLVTMLSGCVLSLPDERPTGFPEESVVQPLLGRSWTEVVDQLGPPIYTTHMDLSSYYLYEVPRVDKGVDPILPFVVYEQIEAHCLLLEFGSDNTLQRFETFKFDPWWGGYSEPVLHCNQVHSECAMTLPLPDTITASWQTPIARAFSFDRKPHHCFGHTFLRVGYAEKQSMVSGGNLGILNLQT